MGTKMKKSNKILLFLVLAIYVVGIFGACKKEDGKFSGEIRSTYATFKVMQNDDDFVDLGEKLVVDMAKNETEGAQLVVTPDKDVSSYSVKTSDLVNGNGTIFPKEQISVYVQTYLNITEKTSMQTNDAYPVGMIPDMLLPIGLAKTEELKISAGNNQSITFEFTTYESTEAGVYTGSVTLILGQTEKEIPVTLNVYDVTIDQMYGKTCFGLSPTYLMMGELNSRWDMYVNYYETMLNDYKICATFVPYYDVSAEVWAENVVKYYDNPNFTSFSIPYYSQMMGEPKEMNYELFQDYLYALAQKCTKEKILFDKAYIYLQPNDEPNSAEDYAHVESVIDDINMSKEKVFERLCEENFFGGDQEYEEAFRQSFYYFENVVTCSYNDELGDIISGYCPHVEFYNTVAGREQYAKSAEISKGEKWFYTAMELYPYPSCAIDDYAIGNRILHWMQKAYDIEGYLYYDVAIYNNFITGEMLDPYADPVRFSNKSGGYPGDGYIFYPTIKYGAEKPIGSLRAVAYRDGREDFALLNVVEQAIDRVAAGYGISVDAAELLGDIYSSVFTGTVYNPDDAAFAQARRDLFTFYDTINGEAAFIPEKSMVDGDTATVNVYTANGVELYCDGIKVAGEPCGNGLKYTLKKKIEKSGDFFAVQVMKDGETLVDTSILTGAIIYDAADLSDESSLKYFAVSQYGDVKIDTISKEVDYVIRSHGETVIDKFAFEPYIAILPSIFKTELSQADTLSFTLRNDSSYDITFEVKLRSGYNDTKIDTVSVKAGESVKVVIGGIGTANVADINAVDMIVLTTANIDAQNELLADRNVSIFGMTYTLR